jgi:PBP1b-binding outer membrane lipoprotein LpoB
MKTLKIIIILVTLFLTGCSQSMTVPTVEVAPTATLAAPTATAVPPSTLTPKPTKIPVKPSPTFVR